ncbi:hypothetical protein AOXY_G8076 [Acipenser oxyrinchus oxyrinchus]|uniref:Uncharacterized protein n=1 Tax=Acipenser oxyrinchus oxyrinchus TaxID=40147 RepID=A0AAD8DIN4_ACIOX|nr:hypothetical protein AOXY_G8076 [Acipenser oxyrinchus oxyrinchus]
MATLCQAASSVKLLNSNWLLLQQIIKFCLAGSFSSDCSLNPTYSWPQFHYHSSGSCKFIISGAAEFSGTIHFQSEKVLQLSYLARH